MNDELSATDVIKKLTTSNNVELNETDIYSAYKTKRNKVVVELCTLRKKIEIKNKLIRHRIEAKEINKDNINDNNETKQKVPIRQRKRIGNLFGYAMEKFMLTKFKNVTLSILILKMI